MTEYTVRETHVLRAPIDTVWNVVDDTARYAEWVDGVLAVTGDHGRARVGATYSEHNRTLGPLTTQSVWTVEEVIAPARRRDSGRGFAPLQNLVNTFEFAPFGADCTSMTYEVTFTLRLGPLTAPVGLILRQALAGEFRRSMRRLETVARAEAAMDRVVGAR
ncbi:SRPBCC family protein [Arthrobacter sp. SLBN-53]|uniref:SRPBCC family protein n=1 Tax=Arthrobacter sp. SLBN-53 TaxID=2768412 RepID=UPI00114ED7B4|nr:SRPBCC family protein [Arthrobacter sp. SLBN-53]TQK29902.1 polyketide cyclase/dehydrase/lipid transport protein [Arthrobacter sp. SLBN-53]